MSNGDNEQSVLHEHDTCRDESLTIQPTRNFGGIDSDSGGCEAEEDGDLFGVQHHNEML